MKALLNNNHIFNPLHNVKGFFYYICKNEIKL